MSSDGRWTGGAANREWQRGTRPRQELLPRAYVVAQLRAYFADCHANRSILNPRYHPTGPGALKMIPHSGDAQQAQIIREYQRGYNVSAAR